MYAISSIPTPACENAAAALAASAGERSRRSRSIVNQWSWAPADAATKTQRSRGTPAASAASADITTSAAPWSTWRFAVISFVYGCAIGRLRSLGVAIASASAPSRTHACSLPAATSAKRAQIAADPPQVLVHRLVARGAQRRLEERVVGDREVEAGGLLRRMPGLALIADDPVRGRALRLRRPAVEGTAREGAGRLAAGQQGRVELARLDPGRRVAQELDGARARESAADRLPRLQRELGGERPARVRRRPGEAVGRGDRLDPVGDLGAAVIERHPRRRAHQLERRERVGVVAVGELAGADDHRRPRIDTRVIGPRRRRSPRAPLRLPETPAARAGCARRGRRAAPRTARAPPRASRQRRSRTACRR